MIAVLLWVGAVIACPCPRRCFGFAFFLYNLLLLFPCLLRDCKMFRLYYVVNMCVVCVANGGSCESRRERAAHVPNELKFKN